MDDNGNENLQYKCYVIIFSCYTIDNIKTEERSSEEDEDENKRK